MCKFSVDLIESADDIVSIAITDTSDSYTDSISVNSSLKSLKLGLKNGTSSNNTLFRLSKSLRPTFWIE